MPPYCEDHKTYHADELECVLMHSRGRMEAREARLREKAEQIAREVADADWKEHGDTTDATDPAQYRRYNLVLVSARAAALAALWSA